MGFSFCFAILVKGSGKEGTESGYGVSRPFQSFSFVPAALGVKFVCLVASEGASLQAPMKYTNVDSWKEFLQALGLDLGAKCFFCTSVLTLSLELPFLLSPERMCLLQE